MAKRDLTEKQLSFVIWAATPDGLREPKTEHQFCVAYGLADSTVWRWKKDPRILDAIRYVILQQAGDPKRVNQVLDMVFEKALADGGNLKAAELWIKAVGISGQFTRTNSILDALDESDIELGALSTEDLERLKAEAEGDEAETVSINRAREALIGRGVDPNATA